jgi:hypothetical protein
MDGHVERMEELINAYKIYVGKPPKEEITGGI